MYWGLHTEHLSALGLRSMPRRRWLEVGKIDRLLALLALLAIAWLSVENARLRSSNSSRPTSPVVSSPLQAGNHLPQDESVLVLDATTVSAASGVVDPVPLREAVSGATLLFAFTEECPYCRRSLPWLGRLADGLAPVGVEVVGLLLTRRVQPPLASDAPTAGWRLLLAAEPTVFTSLGILRVPTTLLVDADGRIVEVWTGELEIDRVREIVAAAERLVE